MKLFHYTEEVNFRFNYLLIDYEKQRSIDKIMQSIELLGDYEAIISREF